jgi:hypothetical protein
MVAVFCTGTKQKTKILEPHGRLSARHPYGNEKVNTTEFAGRFFGKSDILIMVKKINANSMKKSTEI